MVQVSTVYVHANAHEYHNWNIKLPLELDNIAGIISLIKGQSFSEYMLQ